MLTWDELQSLNHIQKATKSFEKIAENKSSLNIYERREIPGAFLAYANLFDQVKPDNFIDDGPAVMLGLWGDFQKVAKDLGVAVDNANMKSISAKTNVPKIAS